jgi:hypothetical protein
MALGLYNRTHRKGQLMPGGDLSAQKNRIPEAPLPAVPLGPKGTETPPGLSGGLPPGLADRPTLPPGLQGRVQPTAPQGVSTPVPSTLSGSPTMQRIVRKMARARL